MKRKMVLLALRIAVLVLAGMLILIISWPVLFIGSFSASPLNVWNKQSLSHRLDAVKELGMEGLKKDLETEMRFKLRRWYPRQGETRVPVMCRAQGKGFEIWQDGQWRPVFVKGVNLGCALPGRWFAEFPREEETYLEWLEKIGSMNANCVRVYTLLPPEFYRALWYYNCRHQERPLWLFQEIWPEEHPPGDNYLLPEYMEGYLREIKYVVDAVHGKARIPERRGRAWGSYDADVSGYVLGYLVGRELEPQEVIATDENNPRFSFNGHYLFSTAEASPTEAWLAMCCDDVVDYEMTRYRQQHPIGIVSWPTLDPIEHDSEWNEEGRKDLEYNDKVAVDINHIEVKPNLLAGFFGAYHIYPNYPDFMNNEEKYDLYRDEEGRLRYGGYLREFIAVHGKYPALVAEFGLATGMGNAHWSPDGYHHGGLREEDQGNGIIRMMKAIKKEGYAGGIIFEWMDEWAKKTWTTEPFMIPYERHVLWHNVIDPEQNYGLLALESKGPGKAQVTSKPEGIIGQLRISHDCSFLYLEIVFWKNPELDKQKLLIGLDTYDRERGEFRFSPEIDLQAPSGMEFKIEVAGERKARILVTPSYNAAEGRFSSRPSFAGRFEEIRHLINKERVTKDGRKIPPCYENASLLRYGSLKDNRYYHWCKTDDFLMIRIPWGRINVTDPSSLRVLDDERSLPSPERDQLRTARTDGIAVHVILWDSDREEILDRLSNREAYLWEGWEKPEYRVRLKKSYYIVSRFFAALD